MMYMENMQTSDFISLCDAAYDNKRVGEKGSAEYASTKSALLDLFFRLVRGCDEEKMANYIDKILCCDGSGAAAAAVSDLYVLLFQTRDCRGGKGEKELFYKMFLYLHRKSALNAAQTQKVLELIPLYGYYKDYWNILSVASAEAVTHASAATATEEETKANACMDAAIVKGGGIYAHLFHKICAIYATQLHNDARELDANPTNPKISLAGKYAPRQQHEFARKHKMMFSIFVRKYMFVGSPDSAKLYRNLIARLNAALEVPEVYMCAKRYSSIDFTKVSSLCLQRFRRAFLNEFVYNVHDKKAVPAPMDEEKGNRFPDDADRVTARQNLKAVLARGKDPAVDTRDKINAKQLMPHEIVKILVDSIDSLWDATKKLSTSELDMLQQQWDILREQVVTSVDVGAGASTENKKYVSMVDVSGSMEGTPMFVAVALGILISEIAHPSFRDRFITFSKTPIWVNLADCVASGEDDCPILKKVKKTRSATWGYNTNFESAMDMILRVVEENKLPMDAVPNLIVFSDMQFDEARGHNHKTHYEQITQKFHDAGMRIAGVPYSPPKIVFWNLRATEGVPVTKDTENTILLSGFSPSLMKTFLDGGDMSKVNPMETLDKILGDERYGPVFEIFRSAR